MIFLCFAKYFIQLSLFYISFNEINCELQVTARCGKPGLPPEASLWLITLERSRFDNEEKVITNCKKEEFPSHKQERECRKGRWSGKPSRCGHRIDANVNGLVIYDCKPTLHRILSSESLNQTEDAPPGYNPLPFNAFHSLRVPLDANISANGSTCYSWLISFDRKVQIWLLLIDIWYKNDNKTELPSLRPVVSKYRTCSLQHNSVHIQSGDKVVGYYFYCDLNSDTDAKSELSDMSDTITAIITTSAVKEIGLEAVFIGDIFTTTYGPKRRLPNCGELEIRNIGVDMQKETNTVYISCNDSFVDMNGTGIEMMSTASGNPKYCFPYKRHKIVCNVNGEWVGSWPVCYPKVSCDRNEIIDGKDSTVVIEEIGNVYYANESHWFAINDTFVRYKCSQENTLLVGMSLRMCMKNGKWSHKNPYCTSTEFPKLAIAGILLVVLIVFVLIVFFIFRLHSKGVKRELRETRNEIEETARKRLSNEFYSDIKDDQFYDNTQVCDMRKSAAYESVSYETVGDAPRYETHVTSHKNLHPEYLSMFHMK